MNSAAAASPTHTPLGQADYEEAKARLQLQASMAYRTLLRTKEDPRSSQEAISKAREAYFRADIRAENLRRTDRNEIARVLAGD